MAPSRFAHRVMYDGLYTFAMRILNVGCAAGLGILTARLLGPAGKGIYALPSVEAGLVASAFTGLGSTLSYFLLNRRSGFGAVKVALAAGGFFVLCGAIAVIPIALLARQTWAILPAILSLPGTAAINLACGYAIGIKRVRYSTSFTVGVTVFTFALMALGLFLIGRNAWVAIAVSIAATTLTGLIGVLAVVRHARTLDGDERVTLAEFCKFSVKVGMVNLVSLLNYRADLYIVALLTNSAALGMYTVAVSAAESLLVPTQVAALVTSPHIGSLDRDSAAILTARCVRNNLLVALIVCGILAALAEPLVHFLYGAAFLPVVTVLQVLLIGVFALSLGSPISSYFTLKLGRPEVPLRLAAIAATVCICVSLLLVPRIGIVGAAIGSSLAYIIGQAAATYVFCRTSRIGISGLYLLTRDDWKAYASFARSLLQNSRALLPFRPIG